MAHIPIRELVVETSTPLGLARMRAISRVKTHIFAFVDDDVEISSNWFQELSKHMGSGVGAVQGELLTFGLGAKFDEAVNKTIPKRIEALKLGDNGMTHNTIIRTDLVRDWKPSREDLGAMEDLEITQHVLRKGYRWLVVPTRSYHYWSWLKLAYNGFWGDRWWKRSSAVDGTPRRRLTRIFSYLRTTLRHLRDRGLRMFVYYGWFRFWCIIGLMFG